MTFDVQYGTLLARRNWRFKVPWYQVLYGSTMYFALCKPQFEKGRPGTTTQVVVQVLIVRYILIDVRSEGLTHQCLVLSVPNIRSVRA